MTYIPKVRHARVTIRYFVNGRMAGTKVAPHRRVYQLQNGSWRMFDNRGKSRVAITKLTNGTFVYDKHSTTKTDSTVDEFIKALRS